MAPHPLILVVDDNTLGALLTRTILQSAGYLVVVAYAAEDALDMLADTKQRMPDLIVLDLRLIGMPGLEFARQVRSVGCQIPILAFSASYSSAETDIVQRVLDAGCNGYVEKNADLALLPRMIALHLGNPRADALDDISNAPKGKLP